MPIPGLPADPVLTEVAVAVSGYAEATAHCGGNDYYTWGEADLALNELWLDAGLCRRLHRFHDGKRPNAACLKGPKKCDASFLGLSALVLTHEAIHLTPDEDEAHTECMAVQKVRATFGLLGETANPLYVDALVRFALYWHRREIRLFDPWTNTRPYFSPECHSGGELDLTPGDGLWP